MRVLLLHGWGGSFQSTWGANSWRDALADRDLIEMDLPGHGANASHAPDDYSDMAAMVASELPDGPIDAIGFSLGAKLILKLAVTDPSRFGRMVIAGIGDNAFAQESAAEPLARALTGEEVVASESPIADLVAYALASGADRMALAAVLRRPANPSIDPEALSHLSGMLLVNGTADSIAMPDDRLRAALAQSDYLSLEDIDHLSLPANNDFRAAAVAFLSA